MSIQIGKYNFEGPYTSPSSLRNISGVYAILGAKNGKTYVADIGESQEVRDRVENHDRQPCWVRQGYSKIEYAAYYCNESERMRVEKELRTEFNPPCGKR